MTVELPDLDAFVERTDGVSAAFVRELLRKAALFAADEGDGELIVRASHVDAAHRDLLVEGGD